MSLLMEEKKAGEKRSAEAYPIILRCFGYYQGATKQWIAECVDLDIMVKADSPEGAFRALRDAMFGYLTVAADGDAKGLIPRPSPLSRRALYHVLCLIAAITKRRKFRIMECSSTSLPMCA